MSDPHIPDNPNEVPQDGTSEDELIEIRRLIVGPERARLAGIEERLDNPKLLAKDISRVLPEAVVLRSSQDKKFVTALTPALEEVIRSSIKRDPKALVSALFPVIGPAIRKAITETLRGMLQSLNQALEKSLSLDGLKWRLEAIRTGKSFAEVVLLHNLVYRVEQVFLIHRETGLLLQHAVGAEVAFQDADMVSGMLTAIQDFVRDSFGVHSEDAIETIQIGALTVWVMQGPELVLAAAIRGTAPEELKLDFQETLENIHLEQGQILESFDGDTAPFEEIRPHLEACLQVRYKEKKQKLSPFLWVILAVLLVALGVWGFFSVRNHILWTEYLEKINAQRGIVVTETGKRNGHYYIAGFRDPLAIDPRALLKESKLDSKKIKSNWESYYSLHPEFVIARVKKILKPPGTVSLELKDTVLHAAGFAPHEWIGKARSLAQVIPGIVVFREEGLVDTDMQSLAASKKWIEEQSLLFPESAAGLAEGQDDTVRALVQGIRDLQGRARLLGKRLSVEIKGHTDQSGSEEYNLVLSRERADSARSVLIAEGLRGIDLKTVGVGNSEPVRREATEQDRKSNRRVSFNIILTDASPAEGGGS